MQKRQLIWLIPLLVIMLLVAPAPLAESHTSPTQDGQFLTHPCRSWRFVFTLVHASGSAELVSPGDALTAAKMVFVDSGSVPVRVALLYLADRDFYTYVTRTGQVFTIIAPPPLVWEIWGRTVDPFATQASNTDVIGFLDYVSGDVIGVSGDTRALSHSQSAATSQGVAAPALFKQQIPPPIAKGTGLFTAPTYMSR